MNKDLSRRDFIKGMVATLGGLIAAVIGIPSIAYLLSPGMNAEEDTDTIDLGPLGNYRIGIPTRYETVRTKINGWEHTAITYGLFVVRRNETETRVFSDICTHLGCRVSWHADQQHCVSPCHDGHFDIWGNVMSGPPPRPLDEYVTKIEYGNLFAKLPPVKRSS